MKIIEARITTFKALYSFASILLFASNIKIFIIIYSLVFTD